MKREFYIIFCSFFLTIISCGSINEQVLEIEDEVDKEIIINDDNVIPNTTNSYKILSLGDSYTIGQSVCETCRFPVQLVDTLIISAKVKSTFSLKIIAKTGWTTSDLKNAIKSEYIANNYDLVTLLIGVNNQYQNKPFSLYEKEFPELVNTALKAVDNNTIKLVVISIPDYAYTPFGRGDKTISNAIDKYNAFAKAYCVTNGITFVNITDITRQGLINTALVAKDNLHPSELAYTKFVEKITPFAIKKLRLD
ncbi:SGNH/GDSL hydrolase family protein [Polaribacter haliotis]|uniref:SGNH/GDSL hydrolase family protein n=1 Tax=Polaribacter haliotis TaxID=1888915 RepID=A0A7L8ACT9_9FLAO|nr:SGNH/GDSL hydrolase family protein [Polaribacter haliotis]QOD59689.1 SGNH/GDSL hydrolase family protein [Polaribacter haliotis]